MSKAKPVHLLARDNYYVCSDKVEVNCTRVTDDPVKTTCKNCLRIFNAYWTKPGYREVYHLNRGIGNKQQMLPNSCVESHRGET